VTTLLDAIAFWEEVGVPVANNSAVALKAGWSPTTSTYQRARGSLRERGMIDIPRGNGLKLTDAGRDAAEFPRSHGTLGELHKKILRVLDANQAKVLRPLLKNFPKALSNDQLAEACGWSPTTSTFQRARGTLRNIGLVEFRDGGVAATTVLFPAELME
jgi:hypothetical protein